MKTKPASNLLAGFFMRQCQVPTSFQPGLFEMRGRRHEESSLLKYCSKFVVSTGHPRRVIDEFAKVASALEHRFKRAN
jgi:hypothetical protein